VTLREPLHRSIRFVRGLAVGSVLAGLATFAGPASSWATTAEADMDSPPAPVPVEPVPAASAPPTAQPVEPPAEPLPSQPEETIDLSRVDAGTSADARPAEAGDPGQQGSDLVSQLNAGSGVQVKTICTNCNAATLTMNGLSGDHVNVTWDGLPMTGGLATVYHLTQFPAELIGHTGVVRGPGSVLTGPGAVGGAIELHTAPREKRHVFMDARLGSWGSKSLRLAGSDRWGPFGAMVFTQYAWQQAVDADGNEPNEVGQFERLTAHGLFDFHWTENQLFTLESSYYGEDQIDGPGAPFTVPDYTYVDEDAFFNWQQYGARWEMTRPSGLKLTWKGRYSRRGQQQWAPPSATGTAKQWTYLIEDEQYGSGFEGGAPVGRSGFITGGAGWWKQRLRVKQRFNDRYVNPTRVNNPYLISDGLERSEAYVQYEQGVGSKWDFTVGVRADWFEVFGRAAWLPRQGSGLPVYHETAEETAARLGAETDSLKNVFLSPRVQAHYRPTGNVVLGLAYGQGAIGQAPSFEETCCGAKYQRNILVHPERARSVQASVEVHPTQDMRLTTTLFRNDLDDYLEKIVYKTAVYIPYYTNTNTLKARVQGIDLLHDMRFRDDRINVGWTYTYTDAEDRTGIHLDITAAPVYIEHGEPGQPLRYVPEHQASAYFRYNHVPRGTQVSVSVNYQGNLRHFRLAEYREPTEPWVTLGTETYTTANVRWEQRLGKKGWTVYAGVDNVTDYVMADLTRDDRDGNAVADQFERCYDWGPITGRFVYAGMRFDRF
jgi:outer membrane receptor protein involved in Fe transport